MKLKIMTVLLASFISLTLGQSTKTTAQSKGEGQNDKIVVQLSDPARPVMLKIGLIAGSIFVKGYSGKEVIVESRIKKDHHQEAEEESESDSKNNDGTPSRKGLRLIPNGSSGLTVEEEDNEVMVSTGSWQSDSRRMEINVQVPTNCSMKLSTVNDGDIQVDDVTGDLEINNTNGAVTLNRISGSVVAHALNEGIKVSFVKVNPQRSMSFSSLNGDIDVTFPSDIKATFNMKSERGEIYSDFDMDVERTSNKVEEGKKDHGRYKVTIERGMKGKVNGGGQEILFKNFNGDIYIRKGK